MRCFTACFRTNSNYKKITIKPCSSSRSISPKALQSLVETHENGEASLSIINAIKEEARHKIASPINLFEESKDTEEEELNKNSRKNLLEIQENGEASINATKEEPENEEPKNNEEEELNKSSIKKVTFDLNVSIYNEELLANQESANCLEEEEEVNELSNSSVSSYISYDPPNHRYHCCRKSDEGFENIDLQDDANNNNNGNEMIQEESSYESLFSLSIDSTRRRNNNPTPEMDENKEVNSPFKQSIKFSAKHQISQLSGLNPIQCKAGPITTPASPLKKKNHEKENIDMNLLDFSITYNKRVQKEPSLKCEENEIAVDTSLSSWLVESSQDDNNNIPSVVPQVGSGESSQDDTSNSKTGDGSVGNSPSGRIMKFDDRSILGELKDEKKPIIIGTVGSYLRRTGQTTTVYSNYGISSC
ncbi:uncharacterized protein LOC132617034 [Lycium barbarum]|uniref:uncharacterized protein LOC132617034 n=1 Tax=Lycium barbarum TaxID=112863 RepID=UPI00293F4990|nr:uncharacterized protein LOC132617034 [Lycium barbarum]